MLIVCWSFEQPRFAGLSANCYDETDMAIQQWMESWME